MCHLVSECRTGLGRVGESCQLCDKGYYKDIVADTPCTKCPTGQTTSGIAKTKASDCSKSLRLVTVGMLLSNTI